MYCPLPLSDYPNVLLAHGDGGRLTQDLIEQVFGPAFANPILDRRHDAAAFDLGGAALAFSTDSYVVSPLFFPGGDIGSLAVNGTVNDLAMAGARALYLTAGFIIEEGLPMQTLQRVVDSMAHAARASGVSIVAGDTKVVERGKADALFVNTAGIGLRASARAIGPSAVRPGDAVLVSGDLARHGIAIMAQREQIEFERPIDSDCAPLWNLVDALLRAGLALHCLRDLTRGGLCAALCEIAGTAAVCIEIEEAALPLRDDVRGACELLGLDPVHVASEGRLVAFVAEQDRPRALATFRAHSLGERAGVLGRVVSGPPGQVIVRTRIGTRRVLDRPVQAQLPRIC
jgi:hydrogenase expression/formation protein HypE